MTDDSFRIVRTAWHEASHALVAQCLGARVVAVTIEPGASYRGLTLSRLDQPTADDFAAAALADDPWSMPASVRSVLERQIAIALAGEIGGDLALWRGALDGSRSVASRRRSSIVDRVQLSADAATALAEKSALPPAEDDFADCDDARAVSIAMSLHPRDLESTTALLLYMRAATRRMVFGGVDRIAALAARLLDVGTVDGAEAMAIMRQSDEREARR